MSGRSAGPDRSGPGSRRRVPGRSRGRKQDRAAVPAVSKALEVALVVLYVAMVSTALFGGVVPDYRTAAAAEVADRTLADAAAGVEGAVPTGVGRASVRAPVPLPDAIRGATYRVHATGEALVLDHPHRAVGGRLALSLPDSVVTVRGTWTSGDETAVVVEQTAGGLAVELVGR